MKRILVAVVAAFLTLPVPYLAAAQTKAAKREPAKPAVEPAPDEVSIRDTFVLATPSERWSLEDPMPSGTVDFAGKKLSFSDRNCNVSVSSAGEQQVLYPISWYAPYESVNPDMKYVVVKYRDGRACSIMAEYVPNRVSMPKASFQPHPDGKSFYSDVATVRQDGHLYFKQVVSQGRDDGKGGLYVDMLLMYCIDDTTKPAEVARKP